VIENPDNCGADWANCPEVQVCGVDRSNITKFWTDATMRSKFARHMVQQPRFRGWARKVVAVGGDPGRREQERRFARALRAAARARLDTGRAL